MGGKGGRCAGLVTLPPLCADCLEMFEAWTSWCPKALSRRVGIVLRLLPFTIYSTTMNVYRHSLLFAGDKFQDTFPPRKKRKPAINWSSPPQKKSFNIFSVFTFFVVRYKPSGRGFDSRCCHWNFSFRSHYGPGVDSASNRNEYQVYFLGVKATGA